MKLIFVSKDGKVLRTDIEVPITKRGTKGKLRMGRPWEWIVPDNGQESIVILTTDRRILNISLSEIRPMGHLSLGSQLVKLNESEEVRAVLLPPLKGAKSND